MTRLLLVTGIVLATVSASAAPAAATFPGANGKIAFDSERDSIVGEGVFTLREIYVMNPDGTSQQRLTDTGCNADPAWSPDGTKILFVRATAAAPPQKGVGALGTESGFGCPHGLVGDIWVMNADGSGQTQLTDTGLDSDPSWSPDGAKVVFRRDGSCPVVEVTTAGADTDPFGESDIYVMNADGTSPDNLNPDDECFFDKEPVWAPDGTRIAFSSSRDGASHIFLMNPDGSTLDNVSGDNRSDEGPDWSPDSARLTFRRDGHVWLMNRDGSNADIVTTGEGSEKQPVWSPDGTLVSFALRGPNTDYGIFVASAVPNSAPAPLSEVAREVNPNWQPIARGTTPQTPNPGTTTPPAPNRPRARRDRRRPRVRVAGINQGCTASAALRVPVRINERVRRVVVRLDGRRIRSTSRRRFVLRINVRRLDAGRHALRIVATDRAGNRTIVRRTLVRCAQRAAPVQVPHFTG